LRLHVEVAPDVDAPFVLPAKDRHTKIRVRDAASFVEEDLEEDPDRVFGENPVETTIDPNFWARMELWLGAFPPISGGFGGATVNRKTVFRMPTAMTISGRSSTITAAFVSSIIPTVEPTDTEVEEALRILGMAFDDVRCAYCGDPMSEWDHLSPLVVDQKPTGFVSEIGNLVPCCGKCNQSKGNKPWRDWMRGGSGRSPKARGIQDLEERIQRLETYEAWKRRVPMNFEEIVGPDIWEQHWRNWKRVIEVMKESQIVAAKIKAAIVSAAD
jgi:hypothetical protein